MMATASLAEVSGLSLLDVYESDDENFISFSAAVIESVVNARENINRELKRKYGR